MGSARPWQVILFIVALVALSGGLFLSCRGGVDLADSILMVDVKTGDRFRFDTSGRRVVFVPGKNPDTGEETLLGLDNLNGTWVIFDRDQTAMQEIIETYELRSEDLAVDLDTFEVTVSDAPIKSARN